MLFCKFKVSQSGHLRPTRETGFLCVLLLPAVYFVLCMSMEYKDEELKESEWNFAMLC